MCIMLRRQQRFFFFNDTATTEIYTLSLHDALPISYTETGGETARGLHAIRVLEDKKDFTLSSLIAAGYDSYLTWFEKPVPALIKAWDETPAVMPLKTKVAEQIAILRGWD